MPSFYVFNVSYEPLQDYKQIQMSSSSLCPDSLEGKGIYKAIQDTGLLAICSNNSEETGQLFLDFNEITPDGMIVFSMAKWTSLTHFSISCNQLGDTGCKYLSRASLPFIRAINLDSNHIGNAGISHLSKTQWKALQLLSLASNKIGCEGMKSFLKGRWDAAVEINLSCNQLQYGSQLKLLLLESKNICTISLRCNMQRQSQEKLKKFFILRKIRNLRQ